MKVREYLNLIKDNWLHESHPMRKAINYMLNRYDSFVVYTTDGRYEIDNNAVENRIRPIAVGRRNWLFAGSHRGARASPVIMSVVQSCQTLEINPQKFSADVLPRLADKDTKSLEGLTPFDWIPAVN